MKWLTLYFTLVFTSISYSLFAQNDKCEFFYSGVNVYSSFQTDTSIWYGTESNVVEVNLKTKKQTRHFLGSNNSIFSTRDYRFYSNPNGDLWFGSGFYFYMWNGSKWNSVDTVLNQISFGVTDLTDTTWSISSDSVYRYHNDSAYLPLVIDTTFEYTDLQEIAVDSINTIWVSGEAIRKDQDYYPVPFVASYNHQKWTVYIDSLGSNSYFSAIRDIEFSKNKGVFLSEGGLYELKYGVFTFTQFSENLRTINLKNDSGYWIGTYGSGVLLYSYKIDTTMVLGNSTLGSNYVDEIAIGDDEIWAAPFGTNLSRYDGVTWQEVPLVGRKYNRRANGVYCHNGTTYVTSYDKLYVYDGLEWKSYDVDLGEGGISMTVDGDGDLFVSSTYRYVYKFDGETFTKYSDFDFSFVNDDYKALATDNNGTVWLSGANKLFYFKDNVWQEIILPSGVRIGGGVRSILFDKNNHLWIAKGAEYIVEYDGVSFHKHSPKEFVGTSPIIYVNDIALDDNGNMWFASEGVYKYDGMNWRLYDSSNSGLLGNYIQAVEPYGDGVWLGTEVGLVDFKNCGDGEIVEFTKQRVASVGRLSLENKNLSVFPNPFLDMITAYSTDVDEKIISLHLYDMLGNEKLVWENTEGSTLNIAEIMVTDFMSNGFYWAMINTSKGVFYKKMLKSNQ